MSPFWEKFFYVLTFLFQGSSFLSPTAYGILHRMHHAYADTEKDPHSPKYSSHLFHMMAKTWIIYGMVKSNSPDIEERFKKNVPHWHFIESFASLWPVRIAWGVLYSLFYIYFATEWWMFLLLPVHYFMGPVHGAIINWFAHKWGYINFKVSDTAKNLLPFDFLMFGESYHNNHHKYGGRANFGIRWHEFDPAYPIILLFDALRIIRLKKNNDLKYM